MSPTAEPQEAPDVDAQFELWKGCSNRSASLTLHPCPFRRRTDQSRTGDATESVAYIRYYAGLADKIHGQTIDHYGDDKFIYTLHQPIGVCGQM